MIDQKKVWMVLIVAFVIGFCALTAGISGRIVMGKITDQTMSSFDKSSEGEMQEIGHLLNRSMGKTSVNLVVSLIKNDSSGFVKVTKDVLKSIGSAMGSSGMIDLLVEWLGTESAQEAFEYTRNQLVESAGVYMPLLQFAAYYHELLLIGGILAGVSLLLWFLTGGNLKSLKGMKILLAIAVIWIIVVVVLTILVYGNLKKETSTPITEETVCTHNNTTLINYRASTCSEKGYSGDKYCVDCRTIVEQGEELTYGNHQYENGICKQCGWLLPGLYVDNQLKMDRDQLVNNSYITVRGSQIYEVLSSLTGMLVVKDGFDVGRNAFYGSSLDMIYLPRSYTQIASEAFNGAKASSINFFGKIEQIGESAFKGSGIRKITIPEGVTSIPGECFRDCESLEEVLLPSSIENIDYNAFENCKLLKSIDLPIGLKTIGGECFHKTGLESVKIPESVTDIGKSCFGECHSLKSVDMSQCSVVKLKEYMFYGCGMLKNVELPKALEDIDSAFGFINDSNSTQIEYLILPETVKHVKLSTFPDPMKMLKWVVWPQGLLDASGFKSVDSLETVYYLGSEYQWGLVTGKNKSDKNIFENVQIVCNATEDDWAWRLSSGYQHETVPEEYENDVIVQTGGLTDDQLDELEHSDFIQFLIGQIMDGSMEMGDVSNQLKRFYKDVSDPASSVENALVYITEKTGNTQYEPVAIPYDIVTTYEPWYGPEVTTYEPWYGPEVTTYEPWYGPEVTTYEPW